MSNTYIYLGQILIDRMWRKNHYHVRFQAETYTPDNERQTAQYHFRFRDWCAEELIKTVKV
jgi:hypothetical protein